MDGEGNPLLGLGASAPAAALLRDRVEEVDTFWLNLSDFVVISDQGVEDVAASLPVTPLP